MTGTDEILNAAKVISLPSSILPQSKTSHNVHIGKFTTIAIFALVAINIACYFRSVSGFFLADDYIHIPWLVQVFSGHPELLLKNFVSNWMQTDGTQFYRPLISFTLAFDYAIWRVNPIGYHLTNLALQIGTTIFLFLSSRLLVLGLTSEGRTAKLDTERFANITALTGGAFFSAFPLHPEVVTWVIARVDSVAAMFYFAALWMYLSAKRLKDQAPVVIPFGKNNADHAAKTLSQAVQDPPSSGVKLRQGLSVTFFILSLLSKETAVTLPAAIALYELLAVRNIGGAQVNLKGRILGSLKSTVPYWILLAAYLIVRTAALGTISGGYTGSIGAGLSQSAYHRWFGDGSFFRILFPLNADVFVGADKTRRYLRILYQIAAGLAVARLILTFKLGQFGKWIRTVGFAAGWFVIAMAPAYQVFNLTPTLQGSRFVYLGTAPLCLLMALLIAPLFAAPEVVPKLRRIFNSVTMACALMLTICFSFIAYRNNEAWVHAGDGVRALHDSLQQWFDKSAPNKKLALLNLPQQYKGAHMLYNGSMFTILMQPPLSKNNYANRIATFEPVMFGDSDLVSMSRIKRMAADSRDYSIFRWAENENKLVSVDVPNRNETTAPKPLSSLPVDHIKPGGKLDFQTSIRSSVYDFLSMNITLTRLAKEQKSQAAPPAMVVSWYQDGDDSHPWKSVVVDLKDTDKPQTADCSLSEHKSWLGVGKVGKITIELPGKNWSADLKDIALKSEQDYSPKLAFDRIQRNSAGSRSSEDLQGVTWVGQVVGPFNYDVTGIPGAKNAMYELSKRNSWFNHYNGHVREKTKSPEISSSGLLNAVKKDGAEVRTANITQSGYYDFRIFAVDDRNQPIGYCSDPVSLWIDKTPRSQKGNAK